MKKLLLLLVLLATPTGAGIAQQVRAYRLPGNPIITPASNPTLGDNINGPSLIRVPRWIRRPLGRYYLYFAHHGGKHIRLAYADRLTGPWSVYEPGTLQLADAKSCYDHVASPDVHIDTKRREILMYFHCPAGASGTTDIGQQKTFLATSGDGVRFKAQSQPLGPAYFRVFRWRDYFYTVVRAGGILRSRKPDEPFEQGPQLFKAGTGILLRHAAVDLRGDDLFVYYSRIGDTPERILVSHIKLSSDWGKWRESHLQTVLTPEAEYEGSKLPVQTSRPDEARGLVHELRDPAIFRDGRKTYLLYSIAGEAGIAIAELRYHDAPRASPSN